MKNEIAVGVLFAIAMVVLAYFTIMVRHEVFEPKGAYIMSVNFSSVEGLEKGDDVKINGVKAGVVESIVLEDAYIAVFLKVYQNFTLYENYRIKIASESALGGKFISIFPGRQIVDNVSYGVVEARTNLKGESPDDPIAQISAILDDNRDNIQQTIRNLRDITAKINRGQGTIGMLVNNKKVHEDANDLIKEVRDTMEDAREQAPVTSFIRAALTFF